MHHPASDFHVNGHPCNLRIQEDVWSDTIVVTEVLAAIPLTVLGSFIDRGAINHLAVLQKNKQTCDYCNQFSFHILLHRKDSLVYFYFKVG